LKTFFCHPEIEFFEIFLDETNKLYDGHVSSKGSEITQKIDGELGKYCFN
jgi:hypothetical protein